MTLEEFRTTAGDSVTVVLVDKYKIAAQRAHESAQRACDALAREREAHKRTITSLEISILKIAEIEAENRKLREKMDLIGRRKHKL